MRELGLRVVKPVRIRPKNPGVVLQHREKRPRFPRGLALRLGTRAPELGKSAVATLFNRATEAERHAQVRPKSGFLYNELTHESLVLVMLAASRCHGDVDSILAVSLIDRF
jgi:hypothetical protein